MRILAVGPLWRGSDAGGLFRAFSRKGCILEVIDEFYYVSLQLKNKKTKLLERIIRPLQIKEFNNAIKQKIQIFNPDILFVYKGSFVLPETLNYAKKNKSKTTMFYPDVSLTVHGNHIPQCIPLYDLIFTTKSFAIKDLEKFDSKNSFFIPHGFDPEIHRKLEISEKDKLIFDCDVSFIGTWSPKKEKWLSALKKQLPETDLKIWGDQWGKTSSENIKSSIMGKSVTGDLYAIAIQCSKINLAILSEQRTGSSSGDLITSRTFHIPAANGFMLHERNKESILYYKEDAEAVFFGDIDEMTKKVRYYLDNEQERTNIKQAGYNRVITEDSFDSRADVILKRINQLN